MQSNNESESLRLAIVTSIHPDYDPRIWKHAISLVRIGLEVHLNCPWEFQEVSKDCEGIHLHCFPRVNERVLRPILIPWHVMKLLVPIIKKVDIIHFHDIDILPWMALVSLFKPMVYDVHENYAEEMLVREWIPKVLRLPLNWSVRIAQVLFPLIIKNIVLVVPHQDHEFISKRINKIHIRNYPSILLLNDFKDNIMFRDNLIIFTGGHYDENGSMLLLDIAEIMNERAVQAQIIATDRFTSPSYRRRFMAEIKQRKLNNIRLIPLVPSNQIMSLMNEASIGILPVLRVPKQLKGIATKFFEYMAAGLPVVASDLPFYQEVLSCEEAGLLAQPECPETFVDAIVQLIREKEYAQYSGINGQRAFSEKYTWESQIPALHAFYKDILTKRGWRET